MTIYDEKKITDNINYHMYKNKIELIESFSNEIVKSLKNILLKKEEAWIVVSGGATPKDLFVRLSNEDIDWSRINITLTDERLVPIDNIESNEGMVNDCLIKNKASSAKLFGLKNSDELTRIGQSSDLNFLEFIDQIDLLILGMGIDGHTASFFTQDPNLSKVLDINNKESFSYVKLPGSSLERITLNYSFLSKSKETYLYITGKEKKQTFKHALEINNSHTHPISIFMQNPINLYWCP